MCKEVKKNISVQANNITEALEFVFIIIYQAFIPGRSYYHY